MVEFVIGMLTHDLIAEKVRRSCSRMRQERFLFGQFQLECFTQELSEFAFDFLGLLLRATETKHPIIRIPHITESAVIRIFGTFARQLPPLITSAAVGLSFSSA